jgi:hypothetical protein
VIRVKVRRDGQRTRGQSLVEFALVLPIFLLLLFGVIDAGRMVYLHTVLSQAAREGARVASVEASWIGETSPGCGTTNGPTCPTNTGAMYADVLQAANRMVQPFASLTASQIDVQCDPSGGAPTGNWTASDCPAANRDSGDVASVRVVSDFTAVTPIISRILGTVPMSASASMVIN